MSKCFYVGCEQDGQGIKVETPMYGSLHAVSAEFCSFQHAIAHLVVLHEHYMEEGDKLDARLYAEAKARAEQTGEPIPDNIRRVVINETEE